MNYETYRLGLILYNSKAPSYLCSQLPSLWWVPSSLNSSGLAPVAPRRAQSGQLVHQPALPKHTFIVKGNRAVLELTVVLGIWGGSLGILRETKKFQVWFLQVQSHSLLFTGSSKQNKHKQQHLSHICTPFSQATSQLVFAPHNGSRGLPEQGVSSHFTQVKTEALRN